MAAQKRKKKRRSSTSGSFWIVIIAIAMVAVVYRMSGDQPVLTVNKLPSVAENKIRVCFLDVGQGDSILIQTPDHAVLIDAGEYATRQTVVSYLREAGVETLDYVVATHPHSDHIGGLTAVLDAVTVKQVLMPDVTHNTTTYEKLLTAIEEKDIPVVIPEPGDLFQAGLITLTSVAPVGGPHDNLNNDSLVLRMVYNETAFLFTGDAERQSEDEILRSGYDLRAHILKSGHHGSNTASSAAFLDAVNPSAVVVSCGKDNSYGHPHAETLKRYEDRGIPVYRTDEIGAIVMVTDGSVIELYVNGDE